MGSAATSTTLYVGIAIVPIAAIGGLIRGYFQGIARIEETAWSQIIEQFFRIVSLLGYCLLYSLTGNTAMNAAYAMGITLLAEVLSACYFGYKYYQQKKPYRKKRKKERYPMEPLLAVALPSSGSRLFGTFTWFLEPIIFLRALSMAGVGAVAATSLYGVISGVLYRCCFSQPSSLMLYLSCLCRPSAGRQRQKYRETTGKNPFIASIVGIDGNNCSGCFLCSRTGIGRKAFPRHRRSFVYDATGARFFLLLHSRSALFDLTGDRRRQSGDDELDLRRHRETGRDVHPGFPARPARNRCCACHRLRRSRHLIPAYRDLTEKQGDWDRLCDVRFALRFLHPDLYHTTDFHTNWELWTS